MTSYVCGTGIEAPVTPVSTCGTKEGNMAQDRMQHHNSSQRHSETLMCAQPCMNFLIFRNIFFISTLQLFRASRLSVIFFLNWSRKYTEILFNILQKTMYFSQNNLKKEFCMLNLFEYRVDWRNRYCYLQDLKYTLMTWRFSHSKNLFFPSLFLSYHP